MTEFLTYKCYDLFQSASSKIFGVIETIEFNILS
jgi:hypothetical protein